MSGDWFSGKDENGLVCWFYRPAALQVGAVLKMVDGRWEARLLGFYKEGQFSEPSYFRSLDEAKDWVELKWEPARRRAGLSA